jgi:hypothetical protein
MGIEALTIDPRKEHAMMFRSKTFRSFIILILLVALFACASMVAQQSPAPATDKSAPASEGEEHPASTASLQKASQNPVANLISFPLQDNTNFGIGPFGRNQNVLNIQPVVPIKLTGNWNMIIRWIWPVIWQPAPGKANLEALGIEENTPEFLLAQDAQRVAGVYGLGDMVPTFFLSPSKPGKLIWGVGPAFALPTATSKFLGQGKLSMGPSVVLLTQPGHWTLGTLVNNVWSIAGSGGRRDVNQMSLQVFITYNLKKGWYLTSAPIITGNWEASSGNRMVVPFGGGPGRIMKLGAQPVNISAQFYGNAVYPSGGSPWSMRLQCVLMFPQKK